MNTANMHESLFLLKKPGGILKTIQFFYDKTHVNIQLNVVADP